MKVCWPEASDQGRDRLEGNESIKWSDSTEGGRRSREERGRRAYNEHTPPLSLDTVIPLGQPITILRNLILWLTTPCKNMLCFFFWLYQLFFFWSHQTRAGVFGIGLAKVSLFFLNDGATLKWLGPFLESPCV